MSRAAVNAAPGGSRGGGYETVAGALGPGREEPSLPKGTPAHLPTTTGSAFGSKMLSTQPPHLVHFPTAVQDAPWDFPVLELEGEWAQGCAHSDTEVSPGDRELRPRSNPDPGPRGLKHEPRKLGETADAVGGQRSIAAEGGGARQFAA